MAKSTQERCRQPVVPGCMTCRYHGSSTRLSRAAGRRRLEALALPAIEGLRRALDSDDLRAILRASAEVLDRCGYPRRKERDVRVDVPPAAERIVVLRLPDNGRGLSSTFDGVAPPEPPRLVEPDDAGDVDDVVYI